MNRAEKQVEVDTLAGHLAKAQVALCADYRGLTVAQITKLRRELRKAGSFGKVVKNTLARLSVSKSHSEAKSEEINKFISTLEGPSFVAYSFEDPIAPTKVLAAFAKENEKFRVKGCWLDGVFVDAAGVVQLSKMPGRNETLSMLLNLISAPATQLVRLLSEPAALTVRTLEAQRKKLGGE